MTIIVISLQPEAAGVTYVSMVIGRKGTSSLVVVDGVRMGSMAYICGLLLNGCSNASNPRVSSTQEQNNVDEIIEKFKSLFSGTDKLKTDLPT